MTAETVTAWQFRTAPHPATKTVFGQKVPLIKDQQQLQVFDPEKEQWVWVGWCGLEAGRPFWLVGNYPEEFVKAATAFVTAEIGAPKKTKNIRFDNEEESETDD